MEIKLDNLIKLPRPHIIMLFCIFSCGVGTGFLVILLFSPDTISNSNATKLLLLSLLATAPVVMPSFAVISVLGHASGKPRTTQVFMTEFTFALFSCFLAYNPALLICYLFGFSLKTFIILAIMFSVMSTRYFIYARSLNDT